MMRRIFPHISLSVSSPDGVSSRLGSGGDFEELENQDQPLAAVGGGRSRRRQQQRRAATAKKKQSYRDMENSSDSVDEEDDARDEDWREGGGLRWVSAGREGIVGNERDISD